MQDEVIEVPTLPGRPKLPKGQQPRRLRDRSKYGPHQNSRECLRRLQQVTNGQLDMAGTDHALARIVQSYEDWLASTPEGGQDPPAPETIPSS
jgi:hypothetical protein